MPRRDAGAAPTAQLPPRQANAAASNAPGRRRARQPCRRAAAPRRRARRCGPQRRRGAQPAAGNAPLSLSPEATTASRRRRRRFSAAAGRAARRAAGLGGPRRRRPGGPGGLFGAGVLAAKRGRRRERLPQRPVEVFQACSAATRTPSRRADLGDKGQVLPRHGRAVPAAAKRRSRFCVSLKAGRRRLRCSSTGASGRALALTPRPRRTLIGADGRRARSSPDFPDRGLARLGSARSLSARAGRGA